MTRTTISISAVAIVLVLSAASCGSSDDSAADTAPMETAPPSTTSGPATEATTVAAAVDPATSVAAVPDGDRTTVAGTAATGPDEGTTSTFQVDVWADNWMAVYIDGELIGEDSVPITTERSFNVESFVFEAAVPFTVAIEARDFMETDSGLEYIGEANQQMGDGGVIAQVTDLTTGEVVATTDAEWTALVVHRAPLDPDCEDDPDPDSTCRFSIVDPPAEWTSESFDDSNWSPATEWSESAVAPKDGYDTIDWDTSARLVWGTDLEIDNTVLLRSTVG